MCVVREEIYCNALSINLTFGGGKRGHEGSATNPTIYRIDMGEDWVIPVTDGVYPIFIANATENAKKQTIAEFISCETNIKMSEVVEEQLKNQLLNSLTKALILELCEGSSQYDGRTMFDILEQVFTNYTKIDDTLILKNIKEFEEAPDFSLPLDVYFKKQEDCQKLAADREVTINEADMVLQLQTHVGSTGMINAKYATRKKKSLTNRGWKDGKKYFRAALKDVSEITRLTMSESGLTTNSTVKKDNMEDKIREENMEKFGESFDTLTLAETMKSDTIEALAESISDLTKSNIALTEANTDLAATNKKLTTQLESTKGRRNQHRNQTSNDTRNTENNEEWPSWCEPNAYCFTCGYKLRKGHGSSN